MQEEPREPRRVEFMEPHLRELLPDTAVLNYCRPRRSRQPRDRLAQDARDEEEELVSGAGDLASRRRSEQNPAGGRQRPPAASRAAGAASPRIPAARQ